MTNNPNSTTKVAPTAFPEALKLVAFQRWVKVLRHGVELGVFVVFAIYVANLIVLPLVTNRKIEEFIDSPYRAFQKLLVAFAIGIAIAVFQARKPTRTDLDGA